MAAIPTQRPQTWAPVATTAASSSSRRMLSASHERGGRSGFDDRGPRCQPRPRRLDIHRAPTAWPTVHTTPKSDWGERPRRAAPPGRRRTYVLLKRLAPEVLCWRDRWAAVSRWDAAAEGLRGDGTYPSPAESSPGGEVAPDNSTSSTIASKRTPLFAWRVAALAITSASSSAGQRTREPENSPASARACAKNSYALARVVQARALPSRYLAGAVKRRIPSATAVAIVPDQASCALRARSAARVPGGCSSAGAGGGGSPAHTIPT